MQVGGIGVVLQAQVVLVGKQPRTCHSKTRLTPALSQEQAARIALALPVDTISAAAATPAAHRILVLDGEPGTWLPAGWRVLQQRGHGLAERLTYTAVEASGRPATAPLPLLPSDTPCLPAALLTDTLTASDTGAVL